MSSRWEHNDFYPTPPKIVEKMLTGIKLNEIGTILEPSAGKGDIISAITAKYEVYRYHYSKREMDIDAVEINPNLRHILKGSGYRVIHDDFLTLYTCKRYGLIIMNPPFSAGDKHLLKAMDMQQNGGKIVCLLNAETLHNPYTNIRKDLVRRLDECGADVEFINGAFVDAERKTDVDVALIRIDIPNVGHESIIIEGLRQDEKYRAEQREPHAVAHSEFIQRIVAQYNFEVRAGLSLINEYLAMKPMIKKSLKKDSYKGSILTLNICDGRFDNTLMVNEFIKRVRYKYWEALFLSDEFTSLFTSKLLEMYVSRISELEEYDFSIFNIQQIKEEIYRSLLKSVEENILALFDEFSHKWHWVDETSKNIHYYNGWKTNKAWVINKKIIIPGIQAWTSNGKLKYEYRAISKLMDIEKVFNYLDRGITDHIDLKKVLAIAEANEQTRKLPFKYFLVTFYKKGTCHIEFTNLELLKKFNLFGSQKKGWLPPSYGKENYENMSAEEQAVINDFEGREDYEKVMRNKDYYLYKSTDLLMIDAEVS